MTTGSATPAPAPKSVYQPLSPPTAMGRSYDRAGRRKTLGHLLTSDNLSRGARAWESLDLKGALFRVRRPRLRARLGQKRHAGGPRCGAGSVGAPAVEMRFG